MPLIEYIPKNMSSDRLDIVSKVKKILRSFASGGFRDVTLRQVYYKLVGADLFPDDRKWSWTGSKWLRDPAGTKNAEPNYKWLGDIVNDARLAGLIDWDDITDLTRNLQALTTWSSPSEIIRAVSRSYRTDLWATQPRRIEVWIEKDAMSGVFRGVCEELRIPFFSCRGYTSQSEMWVAGRRIMDYRDGGQEPLILHFGDHDPSGIDMTNDIKNRLEMFSEGDVEVRRMALNMDQVTKYGPPPNPAKTTDGRFKSYEALYGPESWELDALDPQVLVDIVRDEVEAELDTDKWDIAVGFEEQELRQLKHLTKNWVAISSAFPLDDGASNAILNDEDTEPQPDQENDDGDETQPENPDQSDTGTDDTGDDAN